LKPSSIDYLFNSSDAPNKASAPAMPQQSVNGLVDKAATLWGGQVLAELAKAPAGQAQAFDLVDATGMDIQTVHQVLDVIRQPPYGWVDVDKADPKGNYLVKLSDRGKKYLEELKASLAR
jgi:DNA-binding MarR family transcriptional regulator